MDFDELESLRKHNVAWRLLRADNAAFVLSFLGSVFVEENVRSISATELISQLDDNLYAVNERLGDQNFPKTAKEYLADWSAPETGWLRKYYPPDSDEVHYDATPAVEKALAWVKGLQTRSFIGTESRLNTVFDLLKQLAFGTEVDPEVRLTELRRRRHEIDKEIAAAESGHLPMLTPTAQRDRYQQFATTAWGLLADFREVEANFRALDRTFRERITTWDGTKGALLDQALGDRNSITDSDQGKSFQAFYDFLLSPEKQAEFVELLDRVQGLAEIGTPDLRLRRIHHDWLDAGERTQATVRLLSEQLRRFLDDQVRLENRRVMDILRSIETNAMQLRDIRDPQVRCEMDGVAPAVVLPMERPLYTSPDKVQLESENITDAVGDLDSSELFEQVYVDPQLLTDRVRVQLQQRTQIGLVELIDRCPLEHGLAELITYLALEDPLFQVVFDEGNIEEITWDDLAGHTKTARIPRVTFARATESAEKS